MRVLTASGLHSEANLPIPGLHQFLRPGFADIDHFPRPQRAALHAVFGMTPGEAPDLVLIAIGHAGGAGPPKWGSSLASPGCGSRAVGSAVTGGDNIGSIEPTRRERSVSQLGTPKLVVPVSGTDHIRGARNGPATLVK
jgi:hypothetical protein